MSDISEPPALDLPASEDPQQKIQEERGEREHHQRMEQLQLGDENVEESIRRSKENTEEVEPVAPVIIVSPETRRETEEDA